MNEQKIKEQYKKLLGHVNLEEPPTNLGVKILDAIEKTEKRRVLIKRWIFGNTAITSFGFTLWVGIYLLKDIKETGLWQYLSLMFSENGALLNYWKEFALSVVESLPIMSFIAFLFAAGFFIWSITKINFKKYAFQF